MFVSISPPARYSRYVQRCWYSKSVKNKGTTLSEYYPTGESCILFEHNEKKCQAYLFGPTTKRSYLRTNNEWSYLAIIFRPGQLSEVDGMHPKQLVNQFAELNRIVGQPVDRIGEKFCKASTVVKQMHILYAIISTLKPHGSDDNSRVQAAIELIEKTSGLAKIKNVAQFQGVSVRHLETRIKNQIGLTPKLLSRTIRLQNVLKHLFLGIPDTLTHLAFSNGYADQPHFNNDFRALTGRLPTFFMQPDRDDATLTYIRDIHEKDNGIRIFHQI